MRYLSSCKHCLCDRFRPSASRKEGQREESASQNWYVSRVFRIDEYSSLPSSVSLTRRLADIEDQQNEPTSTGNTDETQFNNMNGTLFDSRAQQDMGSNSHSSLDLTVEKPERRPLGRQETSVVAPALPYDTSLDQFINGQDLSAQPVQSLNDIERPDSGIEPGLFEHLFLPSPSNLCPDPKLTTFDTHGRLTATGDNESLKRSSSSLDLTDLICADL